MVVRSFGGPAFSFFLFFRFFTSSSFPCWRSICFMPSFFFPPMIITCVFCSQHLDWLAYFNLMFLFPLFDWNAKFLFNFSTVDGVHCAEWNNSSVWNCIVNDTALDSFKVKVVGVHEVHGGNQAVLSGRSRLKICSRRSAVLLARICVGMLNLMWRAAPTRRSLALLLLPFDASS